MALRPKSTAESDEVHVPVWAIGPGLVEVVWRRKSYAAFGVFLFLLGGLLYYLQATPVYLSKAQVLVVKKRPDAVTGIDTRNLAIEDYVATHQVLIKSPLILDKAIKKRSLSSLESFAHKEDLLDAIFKALTITRNKTAGTSSSNNVLDLDFRAINGSDCPIVLNAIIESYKDFLDETYRNYSDDTLRLITVARDGLQKDLEKTEVDYRDFREKTPLLFGRNKEGALLHQERLVSIEVKRSALLLRKAEIQGYMAAIETNLKAGGRHDTLLAMMADWASRLETDNNRAASTLTMKNQILPLLMEDQKLRETKGAKHPEVVSLQKQMDIAKSYLANPVAPWQASQKSSAVAANATDPVELYRDYFKQLLNHIDISEKLLDEFYNGAHSTARALTRYELEDEAYRADIDRKQKLYDGIIKRLADVGFVKDVGGYEARTIAPPALAKKVSPSAVLIFPAALLLGVMAGLGMAFLAEWTDKRFHSVEDVRHRMGLTVVGQIPPLQSAVVTGTFNQSLDPMLIAYHRPKSVEAESFRGIRTALYFSTGEGHKVIQITSPNGGDGKSTVAANLAVSIAGSGKKVLLIDADLRKPKVHKIFGMSDEVGLVSILAGEVEVQDAVKDSGIPGLSILACGPLPPNPAEVLTSPRFKEFLDTIREKYDFVLVDTPPLLVVTDPTVVASRVDGVLLTIGMHKDARPQAIRAKEILATLGAKVLGVIVNQTVRQPGYGYGYGYGYTEGYHQVEPQKNGQETPAARHSVS